MIDNITSFLQNLLKINRNSEPMVISRDDPQTTPSLNIFQRLLGQNQAPSPTPTPVPSDSWNEDEFQKFLQSGNFVEVPRNTTPSPTPMPDVARGQVAGATDNGFYQPGEPRYMDMGPYQGMSTVPVAQPPKEIADVFWDYFPNEATPAATLAYSENLGYKPEAVNPYNRNGSVDYGLFQNNSVTLNEMLNSKRYKDTLNAAGIFKPEDVLGDPRKAAVATQMTFQYRNDAMGGHPYSGWYGWQDRGFNPMPDQSLEEIANIQRDDGSNPYFRLKQFLDKRR